VQGAAGPSIIVAGVRGVASGPGFVKSVPSVSALVLACVGSVHADSVVVFNEVMYHPGGNRADLEWIEVANVMSVDVDVSGWALDGAVHFEFPEGTVIGRGGLLVVAASPETLAREGGFAEALGPFAGRLDNSGERIDLRNQSWRIMDSVDFDDSGSWPVATDGSGASLAKRIPDSASGRSSSWTASDLIGGTPGRHNFPAPGTPPPLPRDLVSHWSFDQASGQALDLAGGNNGTLGAGVTRLPGLVGSHAVSFSNGSTSYVNVGAGVGTLSFAAGLTIEALLQPAWSGTEGDQDAIFRKDDGTNRILLSFQSDGANGEAFPPADPGPVLSFGLTVAGAYTELDMLLDGASGRPSLASLTDGTAHHVAATYDAATGRKAIYVDGALALGVDLAPGGAISSGGTAHAYIGNALRRTDPFTGVIDEVSVWKQALAPDDIARHASLAREGKSYFHAEDEPPGPPRPALAFHEVWSPPGAGFWVEVLNDGPAAADLTGCAIGSSQAETAEFIFPAQVLGPGQLLVLTEVELGFRPLAGRNIFLFSADRKAVLAAARVEEGLKGLHPGGAWLSPERPTPGAPNVFAVREDIVINEIMYHPRLIHEDGAPREPPGSWLEILNRGPNAADLTGWRLAGGIDFDFVAGTMIGPGEHLVVAESKDYLRALHPGVRIEGDYARRLSRKGDRILLLDASGNPADEVRYFDGGRWPEQADGGGSSLELRDPRADNAAAEAWAASDEASRSSWGTYSYQAVASSTVGPTRWNEFVLGLLDAGEVLIDDLSVIEAPETAPRELLQDGTFERGAAAWRLLGNHRTSAAVPDPDDPAGQVLHLAATGPTEHMHNHAETTLAGGARVTVGREYRVSFRARWLAGSNQLNTRLYFNRAPRTTLLDVPARNGTPGARNSRLEENIGPTFSGLRHAPAVPAPGQDVAVSVEASDPDGVKSVTLRWSVNNGPWMSARMEARGDGGGLEGTIPGQAAGALVQFHADAEDGLGAVASFPARGPQSRALYRVQDNQAVLGRVHNVRILMTAADTNLLHLETNVMSNERLGATIVVDEKDVFYDCGVRLKGSERGRPVNERVGFNIKFPPDRLFRGVHATVQIDRSGGWRFGRQFGQDEIVIKHIAAKAGGIPAMYDDIIRVIAPRSAHTSAALLIMAGYGDVFLDSQYEDGGEGTAYEFELIYHPTTTAGGSPEGLKRPQPDEVLGTDIRDLGSDKEHYRWNFLIENNRARDDYGPLMAIAKAFSLPSNQLEAGTGAAMDVDQWMRAFTIYSLCGVGDAYTQGNNHNLILYARPSDGRVLAFPWDMDFAFTQAANAPLWGDQGLSRIIQLPANRRLFYAHLLDVMDRAFNAEYMGRWVAHYGSLCGQDFSSITSYITQRRNFVTQSIPAKAPFAITTNGGQDFAVEGPATLLEGTAWFDVKDIRRSGAPEPLVVSWPAPTRWRADFDLEDGPNRIELLATDLQGLPVAVAAITVTAANPAFIRGDADLDGATTLADAVRVLRHLFEGSADLACEDAADADDNEVLNVTDPIRILAHLFLGAMPPPPPHPEPGSDPTRGGPLGCAAGLF
jgi:hypothetical protein